MDNGRIGERAMICAPPQPTLVLGRGTCGGAPGWETTLVL
ncbi:hypothetical protein HMPREF1317_1253 [Schaalia georgiae F0490]|uniref:Uncharacterized protein n=1 Tax=Schaalia georgiae F0490 TaxID=1125717 RepID=J0NWB5_9ACTO|nr:hypothetical protein HMPREF1317_1253 [Schaalia georgiae F0490]